MEVHQFGHLVEFVLRKVVLLFCCYIARKLLTIQSDLLELVLLQKHYPLPRLLDGSRSLSLVVLLEYHAIRIHLQRCERFFHSYKA